MRRPTWIAFGLNGTLLDPAALLGTGREEMGRAALDDAVMQAMADTLTGEHRPFPDLAPSPGSRHSWPAVGPSSTRACHFGTSGSAPGAHAMLKFPD